jgi:hypothetical protein
MNARVRCPACNLKGRPEPNAEQLADEHNKLHHRGRRIAVAETRRR